jgi:tetratricopeptide (TPR) repeat protein
VAKGYLVKLEPNLEIVSTQRFIFFAYTVIVLRYQIENNYTKTLELSIEAIKALKNKGKMAQKNYILGFLIKAISCHIQLKQYDSAETAIEECLSLSEKGSYNWYLVKDYQLLLSFHSGQYEKAIELFLSVRNMTDFERLPDHYKEQWAVHEAYFHYLIAIKKVSPSLKVLEQMGKFRLNKFLNDVPVYAKDKRGNNISLLIIQLMFLIQQKKHEEFSDRLPALEMYSHRYLRKDETFRSNCFIHMMMQVPKGYFNRKNVSRKAEKYVEKLKEVPLEVANQSGELEFIPYETLWGFVISTLKN